MSAGEDSLLDEIMRTGQNQWLSVIDELEDIGYYMCPIDILRCHWFLYPMSELGEPVH